MTRAIVLALSLLVAGGASAGETTLALGSGSTEIDFVARRFSIPTASGRFQHYDGDVALDFDHPEKSRISVKIDTGSIETGVAPVDGFIKGESMLDTARFPTATFVSDAVKRTGDRSLSISGKLTIRSVTVPVTATAVADGDPAAVEHGQPLTFHATAAFSRAAFGIGRDVNVVDDQVEIDIKGKVG